MLENIDFTQAALLAFVLMQFVDALIKPAIEIVNGLLRDEDVRERVLNLWPLYVTVAIAGALAWFTGWNALPVFAEAPIVGRVLTCIGIGLGPSFLHDLKPE
jgi:hypothetical protein